MANLIPQLGMQNSIQGNMNTNFVSAFGPNSSGSIDAPQKGGFKNVMSSLTNDLNSTINAPDQLLQDSVTGNGADVHDVIIAMNKAEIGVNIATQFTTKIVQSYEKIMAIQV
jgi:flagellar hook-basal body complex protein FliE